MNKKGAEDLLVITAYIVIIVVAVAAMFYWIDSHGKEDFVQDTVLAKQIAMLIDSADPGTTMFIEKEFKIESGKVIVGEAKYDFFTKHPVSYISVDGGTEVSL